MSIALQKKKIFFMPNAFNLIAFSLKKQLSNKDNEFNEFKVILRVSFSKI